MGTESKAVADARKELGKLIRECRRKSNLTQEQFGRKFSVSGPCVFKMENGYFLPGIDKTIKMAKMINMPEKTAVTLWCRAHLPTKYQAHIAENKSESVNTGATVAIPLIEVCNIALIADRFVEMVGDLKKHTQ
jgi:DNA-binding XRE family transcriptional regulator